MPRPERRRYDQEYRSYMGEVRDYLGKVERGRSTRKVLADDPAVGEQAEVLRQGQKLDQSNQFFGRYDRMMQDGRRTKSNP